MSHELVRVIGDRPAFVKVPGATFVRLSDGEVTVQTHGHVWICVAVHDVYFLRAKAAHKAAILNGRQGRGMNALSRDARVGTLEAYRRWLKAEQDWYRALGLEPPGWHQPRGRRSMAEYRRYTVGYRNREREFCARGHRMDEANTYMRPSGYKGCWTCRRILTIRRAWATKVSNRRLVDPIEE